jgi:3-oxoadipate enol-lactonase
MTDATRSGASERGAMAKIVVGDGVTIAYRIDPPPRGAGPAARPWIVFAHALAADHTQWDPQVEKFAHAFNVLRFDIRGHGQSSASKTKVTIEQLADDLRALLETLRIARCHFVGSSLGGLIGQSAALRFPLRIASLTLVGTISRAPADLKRQLLESIERVRTPQGVGALAPALLAQSFTPEFQAQHADIVAAVANAARMTSVDGYMGGAKALAEANLTTRLSSIACPVIVVAGADDRRVPPMLAEELTRAISGARLKVIPRAAGLMNIEQSAAFNALLADFVLDHD